MKFKIFVVVALIAGLGWYAGSVQSRPSPQPDTITTMVNDRKVTDTIIRGGGDGAPKNYHSTIKIDDFNHGGPGELIIRGVYDVQLPDILDRQYTMVVNIKDIKGNYLVEQEPVGIVTDKAGVGHWSQEFFWAHDNFPSGEYLVEMIAIFPGQTKVTPRTPSGGLARRRITVW